MNKVDLFSSEPQVYFVCHELKVCLTLKTRTLQNKYKPCMLYTFSSDSMCKYASQMLAKSH